MNQDSLYHEGMVKLARAARGAGRLAAPHGTGARDNPLCGDQVVVDVRVAGGRIAEIGHRTRGCVLCEASASLLGAAAPGRTRAEVAGARARLSAMLSAGAGSPEGAFADLAIFLPVRDVRSRHDCVLLPFDALLDALARAEE